MSTRAYAEVAEALLERLRTEGLAPGTRLPAERQLAEELGVSRPTLREALAALELRGVLYSHVGAGTYVSDNPDAAANGHGAGSADASPSEILTVRLLIEPAVARIAAAEWDRNTLAAIARPLKQLERAAAAGSPAHPTGEDRQFHAAIASASGNKVLASLLAPMWNLMTQTLWKALKTRGWGPPQTRSVAAEHREIFDAIRSRDGDLAAFAMEQHIRRVVASLFADSD